MATRISNQFTKTITLDDGSVMTLSKDQNPNVAVFTIKSKSGVSGEMKMSTQDVQKLFILLNAGYTDMANEQE